MEYSLGQVWRWRASCGLWLTRQSAWSGYWTLHKFVWMFNGMSIKQAIGVAMVLVVALLQMPTLIYQLYTLGYTNTRFKIRTRPGFYEGHAWWPFMDDFGLMHLPLLIMLELCKFVLWISVLFNKFIYHLKENIHNVNLEQDLKHKQARRSLEHKNQVPSLCVVIVKSK